MLAFGVSGPAEGALAAESVIILGRATVTPLGLEPTVGSICEWGAWVLRGDNNNSVPMMCSIPL